MVRLESVKNTTIKSSLSPSPLPSKSSSNKSHVEPTIPPYSPSMDSSTPWVATSMELSAPAPPSTTPSLPTWSKEYQKSPKYNVDLSTCAQYKREFYTLGAKVLMANLGTETLKTYQGPLLLKD